MHKYSLCVKFNFRFIPTFDPNQIEVLMKQQLTIILCLFVFNNLISQVGIGTSNPTAELEINTSNNGLPPLELNPQSSPTGTAAGQIAVIGDQLCLYDVARGKWLSVTSSTYTFGREGDLNDDKLEYAGDIINSGPQMPYDGTLVYATINSSGGNPTKGITLRIFDEDDNFLNALNMNLVNGNLIVSDMNIDFSEGDYFRVRVDDSADGDVSDVSVVLWTKWRP